MNTIRECDGCGKEDNIDCESGLCPSCENKELERIETQGKIKMIKCPNCHREQPEELGACDFCAELREEWIKEQMDGRSKEEKEDESSENLETYNNNK